MIFFTICSKNFMGYASALFQSLREVYPSSPFYTVLCDEVGSFDVASLPFPVLTIEMLGISSIEDMKTRYNITELNTSLKPFAFSLLFSRNRNEVVVYLDPDIFVTSKLVELEKLFADGADCVLTPHITEPAEYGYMNDLKFLTYGIYNLGFCALRDTPQTRKVVSWWGRRLERYCVIDLENGIFVDQKWADYLPAFIEKTRILRHPGYNVAYWNLSQRRLARDKSAWTINSESLRFFHFSGNKIEDESIFSRHSGEFTVDNTPGLAGILAKYREGVFKAGHEFYSTIPYDFSWNGVNDRNEHTPDNFRRTPQYADSVPHLPVLHLKSKKQFDTYRSLNAEACAQRTATEHAAIPHNEPFTLAGFCYICRATREFQVSQMYSSATLPDNRTIPNWREHLECLSCRTINRMRGAFHVLDQEFKPSEQFDVYITEQVTPLFLSLQHRWPSLIGSEYLGATAEPGDIVKGIRNEDVQNLSINDNKLDLILSFDVLEHVPDPQKAFEEFHRCLRSKGRLFFTVPFSSDHQTDIIRASLNDAGEILHILEPEYHGNPVDMEGGALCFRYFGWSVLKDLRRAGFKTAEVLTYWSNDLMYYGDQFIITATKN